MERTITITEKDGELYNYTKGLKDEYVKEYLSNAVEHYEKLCDASGDFIGCITPEEFKERNKNKSALALKRKRNKIIKYILSYALELDGNELDYATFYDGNHFFFGEEGPLGSIYFELKKLRIIDELLKEKN